MPKDPAFLFYSKDWIQGTAQLMPDEKGVFIDLLAHQHQDNDLPNDTRRLARIVGMGEKEFLAIWEVLKEKFIDAGNNRLVNRKLTEISTERSTKGLRNRISGTFASIIRLSTEPYEIKAEIKKQFNIDDFITVPDHSLTESITEWFLERLKSIGDVNGDVNESENNNTVIPLMFVAFKKSFPKYPGSQDMDFSPLLKISTFILKQLKLKGDVSVNKDAILKEWKNLCPLILKDKFYSIKPLSVIANQIQGVWQLKDKKNTDTLSTTGQTAVPTGKKYYKQNR